MNDAATGAQSAAPGRVLLYPANSQNSISTTKITRRTIIERASGEVTGLGVSGTVPAAGRLEIRLRGQCSIPPTSPSWFGGPVGRRSGAVRYEPKRRGLPWPRLGTPASP